MPARALKLARSRDGIRLIVASGLLSWALFFATLGYRAWTVSSTDRQLCDVLYRIVANGGANTGKPGTPGYAYYREHPDELRAAKASNRRTLKELDCDHLPTGG